MKRHIFEILCVVLVLAAFFFFFECLRYVSQRDYVASALLAFIGVSVMHIGTYFARLSLSDRS